MADELEDKIFRALYAFRDEILVLRDIIINITDRLYKLGKCDFPSLVVRMATNMFICGKIEGDASEEIDEEIFSILNTFVLYTQNHWNSIIGRDENRVRDCVKDLFAQYLQNSVTDNDNIQEKIFRVLDPQILLKEEKEKLLDSFVRLIRESCDYIYFNGESRGEVMDRELVEYRNRVYGVLGARTMVRNA